MGGRETESLRGGIDWDNERYAVEQAWSQIENAFDISFREFQKRRWYLSDRMLEEPLETTGEGQQILAFRENLEMMCRRVRQLTGDELVDRKLHPELFED